MVRVASLKLGPAQGKIFVDRLLAKKNQRLFHGAWSFTRSAFERVNGYPPQQSGQDKGLLVRFREAQLRRADPIQFEPRPSYVYRWYTEHNFHLSAMGATGYEDLEKLPGGSVEPIVPAWDRDWVALHEQLKR